MKTPILSTTAAALLAFAPLTFAQDKPVSTSTSSSVTANSDGTATVTIDVNGKKETRTYKLSGDDPRLLEVREAPQATKARQAGKKETWIGLGLGGAINEELRAQLPLQPGEGVRVAHVAPDSPAAKAGIAVHDILVRLDDQVLLAPEQFKKLIAMRKVGDTAKITYLRKGERKETDVILAEHEAEPEGSSPDVLRLLTDAERTGAGAYAEKVQERLRELREKAGPLREKLKEAKSRFPGVVIDKQAFVLGVDGTVKKLQGELQNVEEIMKTMREQLEKANIPPERVEEVRKAVEKVIEKTSDAALKAATDAILEYRQAREREKNSLEAPKAEPPAQPTPPAPPIKAPL
jgi:hypothetical protein